MDFCSRCGMRERMRKFYFAQTQQYAQNTHARTHTHRPSYVLDSCCTRNKIQIDDRDDNKLEERHYECTVVGMAAVHAYMCLSVCIVVCSIHTFIYIRI